MTKPRVEQITKGREHLYLVNDLPEGPFEFKSVTYYTGIIDKPALRRWEARQAVQGFRKYLESSEGPWNLDEATESAMGESQRSMAQAADYGTTTHNLIHGILKGENPDIPPDYQVAIDGFNQWRAQYEVDLTLAEQLVYSLKFRYGGQFDASGTRGDKSILVDWKTGNGIYEESALQVAAYAHAWEEMGNTAFDELWVVRLHRDRPMFEYAIVPDIKEAFLAFIGAHTLKEGLKAVKAGGFSK